MHKMLCMIFSDVQQCTYNPQKPFEYFAAEALPGAQSAVPTSTSLPGTPRLHELTLPPTLSIVLMQLCVPQSHSLAVPSLPHDTTLRPLSTMAVSNMPGNIFQHETPNNGMA